MKKPRVVAWSRPSANGTAPCARCAHSTTIIGSAVFIFGGWEGNRMKCVRMVG